MANYPQLDDCSGVWTLEEVNDAVMGGYWREVGSRAIWFGDDNPVDNRIYYNTIATTGDSTDFGDLTAAKSKMTGVANFTRGISAGGQTPTKINVIEYVTVMSTGNAADFGDLT